jgi:hypothetical protein
MTNNYYRTIKVDSLKIRIPSEDVQIISTTFNEQFQKLYVSGEIDEHISLESHKTDITDGITSRIGLVNCRTGKDQSKEFIYFQLNAKMLKENYLKGITAETVKQIYEYVMNLKIVFVPFEIFMQSYVSDIDFAYDIEITPENMILLNQKIYSMISETKLKYVDKPFRKESNIGIQFNRREKATPTTPFIKIYHKGVEFKHHSNEFYSKYLSKIDMTNQGRIEFTLKNAKHKNHLGISLKTLRNLVEFNKKEAEEMTLQAIQENYIDKKIVIRDYSKLTPVNKIIIFYMESLIKQGYDKQELFSALKMFAGNEKADRRDYSRMKTLLLGLYDQIETGGKKKAARNKEINDVLRTLKIEF